MIQKLQKSYKISKSYGQIQFILVHHVRLAAYKEQQQNMRPATVVAQPH